MVKLQKNMCIRVLILLVTNKVYAGNDVPIFNCSQDELPVLIWVEDTLSKGDVLIKINDLKGFREDGQGEGCEGRSMLEINGTDVKLTHNISEYCDILKCTFICNSKDTPYRNIRVSINRTKEYQIVFNQTEYNTSVYEEVTELNQKISFKAAPSVELPNCIHNTYFAANTRRYELLTNGNGLFKWGAETSSDSLIANGTVDYEINAILELDLQVSFRDIKGSARTKILVLVIDIDDNNPKFDIEDGKEYALSLRKQNCGCVNIPQSTQPPLRAFDPNFGLNKAVFYRIEYQTEAGLFDINKTDGTITVTRELNWDVQATYRVIIEAYQEDKPLTATGIAVLIVTVEDIDEHTPVKDSSSLLVPLSVVIGLFTLLVILLVIVICCCWFKTKRSVAPADEKVTNHSHEINDFKASTTNIPIGIVPANTIFRQTLPKVNGTESDISKTKFTIEQMMVSEGYLITGETLDHGPGVSHELLSIENVNTSQEQSVHATAMTIDKEEPKQKKNKKRKKKRKRLTEEQEEQEEQEGNFDIQNNKYFPALFGIQNANF